MEVEGVQLQAEHLTESLAESVLRTHAHAFSKSATSCKIHRHRKIIRAEPGLNLRISISSHLSLEYRSLETAHSERNRKHQTATRKNMRDTKLQAIELRMAQLRVPWTRSAKSGSHQGFVVLRRPRSELWVASRQT